MKISRKQEINLYNVLAQTQCKMCDKFLHWKIKSNSFLKISYSANCCNKTYSVNTETLVVSIEGLADWRH